MKDELSVVLRQLETTLIKINAPILEKFNAGLFKVGRNLKTPKVNLPDEVEVLYKWRNGVTANTDDTIGSLSLFIMGIFMPFEEAKSINIQMVNNETGWGSDKFPLFESGGGEYFLIDCDPYSTSYKMIFLHSIGAVEFDTMITHFDNLVTLFRTVNECFEKKVCFYDDKKQLDFKYDEVFKISKEINVRSEYWKLF